MSVNHPACLPHHSPGVFSFRLVLTPVQSWPVLVSTQWTLVLRHGGSGVNGRFGGSTHRLTFAPSVDVAIGNSELHQSDVVVHLRTGGSELLLNDIENSTCFSSQLFFNLSSTGALASFHSMTVGVSTLWMVTTLWLIIKTSVHNTKVRFSCVVHVYPIESFSVASQRDLNYRTTTAGSERCVWSVYGCILCTSKSVIKELTWWGCSTAPAAGLWPLMKSTVMSVPHRVVMATDGRTAT